MAWTSPRPYNDSHMVRVREAPSRDKQCCPEGFIDHSDSSLSVTVVGGPIDGKKLVSKTILMDTPKQKSVEDLVEKANNRDEWNLMCNMICPRKKRKEKHKSDYGQA